MKWHRVLAADELPDGRVTTVAAGHKSVALVHYDGQFSALDNHCPHQGGPLGEGTIEKGLLRCPWHGYDYCPLDGKSPGAYGDTVATFPVEVRHDGAAAFAASAYAKLTGEPAACLTIAGPGATNLLTGLWDAKLDRAPVLALTGQVDIQVLGPGAFQEVDLSSAFRSVAGWSQVV